MSRLAPHAFPPSITRPVCPHTHAQVDNNQALLVLFSGEKDLLNNGLAKTGRNHNAPRNIGFVKVPRVIDNDMDEQNPVVLSDGPVKKGGFWNNFNKKNVLTDWEPYTNKGVQWLTDFTSMDENACRIKVAKLSRNRILILYEIWTATNYVKTMMMMIDDRGRQTLPPRPIGFDMRMPFADEILVIDPLTVVLYAGAGDKLVQYRVSLKDSARPDRCPQMADPPSNCRCGTHLVTRNGGCPTLECIQNCQCKRQHAPCYTLSSSYYVPAPLTPH